MNSPPHVFLTGGEGIGWALDIDVRLTREALEPVVAFTDLAAAEVVHSVNWDHLARLPAAALAGKRIVCQIPGEPFRYLATPRFRRARGLVGAWITVNSQAHRQLTSVGIANFHLPYIADSTTFQPHGPGDSDPAVARARWNLPTDRYLIGSFQRDSEGKDLARPKLVKGPDVFAEIVHGLVLRGAPIHVVLAGPRRHWLRAELAARGVPFTFIGQPLSGDDHRTNVLPQDTLAELYALIDLYLVASRSEGGPKAILEGPLAACKVLSTPVGLAEDVLEPTSIFRSVPEAIVSIELDIGNDSLARNLQPQRNRVLVNHGLDAASRRLRDIYASLNQVAPYQPSEPGPGRAPAAWRPFSAVQRLLRGRQPRQGRSVTLWHEYHRPPYGGGNQFMLALRNALNQLGTRVDVNSFDDRTCAHVVNSHHFEHRGLRTAIRDGQGRVVHRVDGPMYLIRGTDQERDDAIFAFNERHAAATVVQSAWSYQRIIESGYRPVAPVIIHNAVDPELFHANGRISFQGDRKVRLIATSWSDNPRKGGSVYRWMDEHLDWDRFEFTYVGRVKEEFQRVRHIAPVPSEQLGDLLREHDVYITASQNDPCSNALIEALACGLPALYLNDGGHPELVGQGGLPFTNVEEISGQLEILAANLDAFRRLITVSSMEEVARKYLELLVEDA